MLSSLYCVQREWIGKATSTDSQPAKQCALRVWCLGAERASIYTRSTKFAYTSIKYLDLMTIGNARALAIEKTSSFYFIANELFYGKFLAKFLFLSFSRETGATRIERTVCPKSNRKKSQKCAMQSQQCPNCWPALSHGVQLKKTTESHPFWNRSTFRAKIKTQFYFSRRAIFVFSKSKLKPMWI